MVPPFKNQFYRVSRKIEKATDGNVIFDFGKNAECPKLTFANRFESNNFGN
jgi:hypothetical protein